MRFTERVSAFGLQGRPQQKEWIATAIGAGASVLSSIIGGNRAAHAARQAEKRQRAREAEENAYFTRRYNEDYADTAAGQRLITRAKEYARQNWRKAAGAQAVSGGTDAATAMAKEAGNRMIGDTIGNIAATDAQRKANVDAQHNQARQNFAQMDMQRELGRAQAVTDAAAAASNAIMSGAAAFEQASNGTVDLKGGSNKGKEEASV